MGLDNRDYVHDESGYDGFGGGFGGGGGGRPGGAAPMSPIAKLIAASVVSYVLSILIPQLGANLALSWDGITSGKIWQVLTYGFANQDGGRDILFFAIAMFVTYQFSRLLERVIGTKEVILLYLSAILIGGLAHLIGPAREVAIANVYLGGAVILLWAAMAYPREKILLFFILPVELWLVAAFMIAGLAFTLISDRWYQAIPTAAALIFTAAHFKTGFRLNRFSDQFADWRAERSRPKLRVVRPEPDDDFDIQVDDVLAKLSREGEASLTSKERKILKQASKRYKDRV